MKALHVRITVRRLMVIVACAGLALGLAIEASRAWSRYLFCAEQERLFTEEAFRSWEIWHRQNAYISMREKIFARFRALGPSPRTVASLLAPTGDPDWDKRQSKLLRFYLLQHGKHFEDDVLVAPSHCAEWLSGMYTQSRQSSQLRAKWAGDSAEMALEYRRAAWCPWASLPRETYRP